MRRAGVVLLLLLLGSATAAMAFSTGTYKGRSGQSLPVSFKASKKRVTNFVYEERGMCSDGEATKGKQGPLRMRVHRHGRFGVTDTSPSGATTSHVAGRLRRGGKATGTFRVDSRFDEQGQPDPNGSITCTTETVHWSAKLR